LLPQLQIELQAAAGLDPHALFDGGMREIWLEIGFGAGEHLAAQALAHPDVGFIGAEPYLTGAARLLSYIDEYALKNVRILTDDAGLLLQALPSQSIARAFLLFPDPWPKKRHHKRRFVNPANINEMARVLSDDGLWRMATDDMSYCRWMLAHMTTAPSFSWTAIRADDWRRRPKDWPATRYEAKAIAQGRRPAYLSFSRIPRTKT
jgi:tRNA (guanine-N7-)-methyltransferase